MRPSRIISVGLLASIIIACSVPNVANINLSECMKPCNETAKQCLNDQDNKIITCGEDKTCSLLAVRAAGDCLTAGLDCINVCVEQMEHDLKK